MGATSQGFNDEDADPGALFEGHDAARDDSLARSIPTEPLELVSTCIATDQAAGAPVDGARVSNQDETPVHSETATSQQPQATREGLELYFIDERSYMSPDLQRWIFDQLGTYTLSSGSSLSSADTSDIPGALKVYNGNLPYTENAKRKLVFSNETELRSKAYIVDKQNPRGSKSPVSSCNETQPYIGAGWSKNNSKRASPH